MKRIIEEFKNEHVITRILFLIVADVILFFLGNHWELFAILIRSDKGVIDINYNGLACFIAVMAINVLTVYHIVLESSVKSIVQNIDKEGTVKEKVGSINEGLNRVEAHLINYDSDSIEFKFLSTIEANVGIDNQDIHNEIWVLTNNFVECKDSKIGIELRSAIKKNLTCNVDYYYVIPKSSTNNMEELKEKLIKELQKGDVKGEFYYTTDDALDLIPTPYFDIIMYFKMGRHIVDEPSAVYYCFSREDGNQEAEKYYYQKVSENSKMNDLIEKTREYKNGNRFVKVLGPQMQEKQGLEG